MTCRDVREVADSFLGEELLTETNHEILRHLEACPSCRAELDDRRRLHRSLRAAFDRAPDLQPSSDFAARLRDRLRAVSLDDAPGHPSLSPPPFRQPSRAHSSLGQPSLRDPSRQSVSWWALAASVALAVGAAAMLLVGHPLTPIDALAGDARGDHWNCALKNRTNRTPLPLEQAAERFDRSFRVLLTSPADDVEAAGGVAHVLERHSCAFGARRFGHVILEYQGRIVSLLLTAYGDAPLAAAAHVHEPPVNGVNVVSVRAPGHAIVLVSDLDEQRLTTLSDVLAVPLAKQLSAGIARADRNARLLSAENSLALLLPR
jgi:hypothetical protein